MGSGDEAFVPPLSGFGGANATEKRSPRKGARISKQGQKVMSGLRHSTLPFMEVRDNRGGKTSLGGYTSSEWATWACS